MFEKLLTGFGYWQPLPALLSNVLILLLLVMIFFPQYSLSAASGGKPCRELGGIHPLGR